MKAAITASRARFLFASARSVALRTSHAQCTPWRTPQNASSGLPEGPLTVNPETERFTAWSAVEQWHM